MKVLMRQKECPGKVKSVRRVKSLKQVCVKVKDGIILTEKIDVCETIKNSLKTSTTPSLTFVSYSKGDLPGLLCR